MGCRIAWYCADSLPSCNSISSCAARKRRAMRHWWSHSFSMPVPWRHGFPGNCSRGSDGGLLGNGRLQVQRTLERIAIVDAVTMYPHLLQAEQWHGADIGMDCILGLFPERQLALGVRLDTCSADLLVGHRAMRKIRHRGGRADRRSRVIEF